ncbi:hypothetical protein [Ekhidna sp.]
MEIFEYDFHEGGSNFDDRLDVEDDFFGEIKVESEPIHEEELYYRSLEEY